MKRIWVYISAFFLLFGNVFAQSPYHYWEHTYVGPISGPANQFEYINLIPLPDGGCIGTGVGGAVNNISFPFHYLHRLGPYGNLVWSLPTYTNVLNQEIALYDTMHLISVDWQDSIRKVSFSGQVVWAEIIPPLPSGYTSKLLKDLQIDANKNIMILRREYSINTNTNSVFDPRIIVLDSNRNMVLDTILDTTPYQNFQAEGLLPTQDGNFIVYGYDSSSVTTEFHFSMIKFDLAGNVLWSKMTLGYEIASSVFHEPKVFELPSQELLLLGNGFLPGTWGDQIYLQRFNQGGDSLRTYPIATNLGYWDADIKDNSNILLTTRSYTNFYGAITEIDTTGNILFAKGIEIDGEQVFANHIKVQGDDIFVAGKTNTNNLGFIARYDSTGSIPQNLVSGTAFYDTIPNCIPDSLERRYDQRLVKIEPGPQYRFTDHAGNYEIGLDSGQHYISLVNLNPYWQTACPTNPDSHSVYFNSFFATLTNVNFALEPTFLCPNLHVDISSTWLRSCFIANYYVTIDNRGTSTADSATVLLSFDSLVSINSIPLPYTALGNNEFLVELGDIDPLQTISFLVQCSTSCNLANQNRTSCATAHVFPDSNCLPTNTLWDGSSLQVEAGCLGDSVEFIVTNTGQGNMMVQTGILIAEDDILKLNGSVQLNAGQDTTIRIQANGSTWTCITNQTPAHPFPSFPRATVEACSTNAQGQFSLGRVTTIMQDDQMDFISIDCDVLGAAYDPNDKRGFPLGTTVNHLIGNTDVLDYHIRFQNTGTDTAYTVVIRDQLPSELDVSTLQAGASSHPYTIQLLPNNTLMWTFDNIYLPDSNSNMIKSQGFVKFKIDQTAHLTPGTKIKNAAEIYFDYNPAVLTDTAWHTLSDTVFRTAIVSIDPGFNDFQVMTYPNPFTEQLTFVIPDGTWETLELNIYDLQGKLIHHQNSPQTDRLTFFRRNLPAGTYIFHLESGGEKLGIGKIIAY